jgi:hypothetical protein
VVSKYGWGLVVVGGILWLVQTGILILAQPNLISFTGNPSNTSIYPPEAYSDLVQAGTVAGVFGIMVGLFLIFIGMKAFRKGEKWAWYAVAVVPIFMVLNSYSDYVGAGPGYIYSGNAFPAYAILSYLLLAAPTLIGLLISTRSFFPSKPKAS